MDACFIIFDATFSTQSLRDRAAFYLSKDTRPEWGDDYPDEDETIFEAVDDCIFPLKIELRGECGLRWICSGGEYDDIPADWPERLQAQQGFSIICISAGGEIEWQVLAFDGNTTQNRYVTRFYDDRGRDQPIEDFERQFTTPKWQLAMFDDNEDALLAMADIQAERWIKALSDNAFSDIF